MNKFWRLFYLLVFFLVLLLSAYTIYKYNNYSFFRSSEYHSYRKVLGHNLSLFYFTYYSSPYSLDRFIYFMENEIEDESQAFVSSIEFLKKNNENLRLKQLMRENKIVMYSIGFDEEDNNYCDHILDYDSISFMEYLKKPDGDIIITWSDVIDICEGEIVNFKFFKNGICINNQGIADIMFDTITPNMHSYLYHELNQSESVLLLYILRFDYSEQTWDGGIICNWNRLDSTNIRNLSNKLFQELNKTQLVRHVDSLIYPIIFKPSK